MTKLLLKDGKVLAGNTGKPLKAPEGENRLKKLLDTRGSAAYLFYKYKGTSVDDLIKYDDTENVTDAKSMFQGCTNLTTIPLLNTSKVNNIGFFVQNCTSLIEIPQLDMSEVTDATSMFQNCTLLKTIPPLNTLKMITASYMFSGCTSLTTISQLNVRVAWKSTIGIFQNCTNLTNLNLKNIQNNIQIGSGTTWGHLLTLDSLINTIKELVDTGSSKTLTMGSANLEKIANVYVRLTGEAEEVEGLTKVPCEVCNETDEGAMLITAYANSKNWTIA